MRAAVSHLIEAGRLEGLREIVERLPRQERFRRLGAGDERGAASRAAAISPPALPTSTISWRAFPPAPARIGGSRAPAAWRAWAATRRRRRRVREGIARFPGAAPPHAFLANLLSRAQRPHEALQVWRDAHARFPEPELPWFSRPGERADGDRARGTRRWARWRRRRGRFPDDRRTPALIAEVAEARAQWGARAGGWEAGAARFGADAQAEIGRARALFRLDRVEEALARLDALLAPRTRPRRRRARARGPRASNSATPAAARALLTRLTRRSRRGRARGMVGRARPRRARRRRPRRRRARRLSELERRFPDSALAARERLRLARRQERGLEDLHALISTARERFPDDADLVSQWVWLLLSQGRLAEAERHVEALEAQGAPGFALAARLKLEADRGDAAFRAYAEALAAGARLGARRRLRIRPRHAGRAGALGVRPRAAPFLDAAAARFPGSSRDAAAHPPRIARRRDSEALALIDAIPAPYVRRDVLELRAWAEARAAATPSPSALGAGCRRQLLSRPALPRSTNLTRISPDDRPPPEAGPTAFVVFRNEAAQMHGLPRPPPQARRSALRDVRPSLHRRGPRAGLGRARRDPLRCPDSYQLSWSGRRWINEIVAREGARGWGLQTRYGRAPDLSRLREPAAAPLPRLSRRQRLRGGARLHARRVRAASGRRAGPAPAVRRTALLRRRLLCFRPRPAALSQPRRRGPGAAVRGQGISAQGAAVAARRRADRQLARKHAHALRRRLLRAAALTS